MHIKYLLVELQVGPFASYFYDYRRSRAFPRGEGQRKSEEKRWHRLRAETWFSWRLSAPRGGGRRRGGREGGKKKMEPVDKERDFWEEDQTGEERRTGEERKGKEEESTRRQNQCMRWNDGAVAFSSHASFPLLPRLLPSSPSNADLHKPLPCKNADTERGLMQQSLCWQASRPSLSQTSSTVNVPLASSRCPASPRCPLWRTGGLIHWAVLLLCQ